MKWLSLDDKVEFVKPWIRGKRVLDLGCVDHSSNVESTDNWMHSRLLQTAASVVGVDILEDDVLKLRGKGYDVRVGDVQRLQMNEKFDVVFAGEIIEHLANLEGFLDSVKSCLKSDGVVIITTPNVFAISHFIMTSLNRRSVRVEHTCWFDIYTLSNLLRRYSFEPVEIRYIRVTTFADLRISLKSHSVKKVTSSLSSLVFGAVLPRRISCMDFAIVARYKDQVNSESI